MTWPTGFDFLLRHSKGKLCAVIVTRSDPVLPLHRYRLGGLVTEVRLADLAFSHDEVRELVVASGLTLADQSIEPLVTRTRGWAAGLRFATMWLRHQPDPDAAVLELAGDTGNIAEYLMAEVLELQSEADRELLLNTCVVEILRPGLIEELGGRTAARGLAQLAHGNAMVETVADHPGWFRYHPFFRELLRAELNYLAPARAIALHRRAAPLARRQRGAGCRGVARGRGVPVAGGGAVRRRRPRRGGGVPGLRAGGVVEHAARDAGQRPGCCRRNCAGGPRGLAR